MLRVQVLLLAGLLAAAEIGEEGLAALSAARAGVGVVAGGGTYAVLRGDEPEHPGEARRIRFAVAADGRYDIVKTDPADPQGERTRLVSDGRIAAESSQMTVEDAPVVKRRRADADLFARLLACLRLDLAQLRRDYAVELVAAADGGRELRLVPGDPALSGEIARIVVAIDDAGIPRRLVLDEPSGNRHRLVIERFADDPPAQPGWFSVPSAP